MSHMANLDITDAVRSRLYLLFSSCRALHRAVCALARDLRRVEFELGDDAPSAPAVGARDRVPESAMTEPAPSSHGTLLDFQDTFIAGRRAL